MNHPKLHDTLGVSRSSLYYKGKQVIKDWKTKQKSVIAVSVILAIILLASLFFVIQNKSVTPKQGSQRENTLSLKYINEIAGFSFNYPISWKTTQNKTTYSAKGDRRESFDGILSPDFTVITLNDDEYSFTELKQGGSIDIYVQESPTVQTLKDLQEFNKLGRDGPAYVNERIIKLGNVDVLLYDYSGYASSTGYHLDMLHNNNWIRIDLEYKGIDGKKVFDEILSSFLFYN